MLSGLLLAWLEVLHLTEKINKLQFNHNKFLLPLLEEQIREHLDINSWESPMVSQPSPLLLLDSMELMQALTTHKDPKQFSSHLNQIWIVTNSMEILTAMDKLLVRMKSWQRTLIRLLLNLRLFLILSSFLNKEFQPMKSKSPRSSNISEKSKSSIIKIKSIHLASQLKHSMVLKLISGTILT